MKLRIVTYNVHKCRGLDRRTRPDRIGGILRELDADVIALQEVMGADDYDAGQAARIAGFAGGYSVHFGENRRIRGAAYGNAVLSRLPVRLAKNYDLTCRRRERRGCLRVDVEVQAGILLHIFNVHLGTGFLERRQQARRLLSDSILRSIDLQGPSVVVGDFNEWTRGLASRLMADHYDSVNVRAHIGQSRSYPGVFPIVHLDHFYFDRRLALERCALLRTRRTLLASDHLPLVAEFTVSAGVSREAS